MRYRRSRMKRHNPSVRDVTPADVEKRVKSIRSRIRKAIQATEVDGTLDTLPKWTALKNAVYDLERDAYASGLPSDFVYLLDEISRGQVEGESARSAYLNRQLKDAYEEKRLSDIQRRRHEGGWRNNPTCDIFQMAGLPLRHNPQRRRNPALVWKRGAAGGLQAEVEGNSAYLIGPAASVGGWLKGYYNVSFWKGYTGSGVRDVAKSVKGLKAAKEAAQADYNARARS